MTKTTKLFGPLSPERFTDDPVTLLQGRTAEFDGRLEAGLRELREDFEDLPDDLWLKTDYIFRQRRFSLFKADTVTRRAEPLESRPFYQSTDLNPYAGGVDRTFAPLDGRTVANPFLHQLIWDVLDVLPPGRTAAARDWEVGVHLMRILARPGEPGYPAPEGMHHDGHAFTSITLVNRVSVEGGRSLFATLDGTVYRELELRTPVDTVVFEDPRCLHDVTPVTVSGGAERASRDVCGFSLNPL
ncbi:2OG-Fe dioxygenase family protein [Streptosporangium sp. NPDC051022]|uniref:2OG-Fe dioxygenase family protein n=1 Tax=Streptosporangium sp. NPDC051022 TaxID=3155752 RepID=UPI003437D500